MRQNCVTPGDHCRGRCQGDPAVKLSWVMAQQRFGVASFILDITSQRAYERSCQVAPHDPEAQEEIERKIGQSLPRSGLTP
jgi:hypothetical protein